VRSTPKLLSLELFSETVRETVRETVQNNCLFSAMLAPMERIITLGLLWKLRRVAAGLRQQDVANAVGISMTRYSGIERGEITPVELETRLVDQCLPPLPSMCVPNETEKFAERVSA
jgi:DNA-binding XRE family transcriptional regulator